MIDSVRYFCPYWLANDLSPEWELTETTRIDANDLGAEYRSVRRMYKHLPTGLATFGDDREIRYIRASLPRLLYGSNHRLIATQRELRRALSLMHEIVETIGEHQCDPNERFTRVDLVWQFRGDPADYLAAHRNAKHPNIRKSAGHYDGESMYWRGSEFQVKMYDKSLQAFKKRGDVVRVELQLSGRKLAKVLGIAAGKVKSLEFFACYRAYRGLLLKFEPSPLTAKRLGIPEILVLALRDEWEPFGVTLFETFTRGMSPRQVQRIRKQMAALRPEVFKISWHDLLPEDCLPPIVEPVPPPRHFDDGIRIPL